jgi:WD40 repeat protein
LIRTFTHPGRVQGFAWHPEGELFAAGCSDYHIHLWDVATGEQSSELVGHEWFPVQTSFSPGGDFLLSYGWEGALYLWDPYSGHELLRKRTLGFISSFSASNNRFGVCTGQHSWGIFEVASGLGYRLLRGNPGTDGRGVSCDFTPDGRFLVSSHENSIRLWDVHSAKSVDTVLLPQCWSSIGLCPDGTNLVVTINGYPESWSIDVGQLAKRSKLVRGHQLNNIKSQSPIRLSADGLTICSSASDGLHILDARSGEEITRLAPIQTAARACLSPSGRWAADYTVHALTNLVQIWNVTNSNVVKRFSAGYSAYALFSSDDKWFTIGDTEQFRTWDTGSWELAYSVPRELSGHYAYCSFSPDGKLLALALSRDKVRLVEADTGRELATLEGPDSLDIEWITFNRDGTRLAVVDGAGAIQLWDLCAIRQQLASMNLDWDLPPYPGPLESQK